MNRTERLYWIEKLLRTNRCVPVSRILDELGVSIATFKRDVEYLRSNLNAPIEWNRECRGYHLTPDGHCPHCRTAIAGRYQPSGKPFGSRRVPLSMK